jgi:membrane protease YdiL (CAAX protease family)
MDTPSESRRPWNPDPAWADPLIALLAVVALLLSSLILVRRQSPPPAVKAGFAGRLAELPFAASRSFPATRAALSGKMVPVLDEPWDRAVLVVLQAAEGGGHQEGMPALAGHLPGPAAEPFRRCWARAFEDAPPASLQDRARVREALGDGWAAAVLEARLERRDGREPGPGFQAAQGQAVRRLMVLMFAGAVLGVCGLGGVAFALFLVFGKPARPAALPGSAGMPARTLVLVFLAWFLGLLVSGTLVATLAAAAPGLAPFTLPLAYALHAAWGTFLLCRAQGLGFSQLWSSLAPGSWVRALLWGAGFLALAVPSVLLAGLLLGPLTRHFSPPQRDLLQTLAGLRSPLALLLSGLTVAVLAPAFEELLFRGTVLPWTARRWGWAWGLAASSLLFGMMHLQLAGLPTLTTLGLVLGLAFRQGHSLWAPILVHGLWNGGVFLFLRALTS